jgi:transposase
VNTTRSTSTDRQRRRQHSPEFKASLIEACSKPGVSIAAIALANGVNANLLRRWIVNAEAGAGVRRRELVPATADSVPASEAFIAVATTAAAEPEAIRVEIRRGATCVSVAWPMSASVACAAWLREVLR